MHRTRTAGYNMPVPTSHSMYGACVSSRACSVLLQKSQQVLCVAHLRLRHRLQSTGLVWKKGGTDHALFTLWWTLSGVATHSPKPQIPTPPLVATTHYTTENRRSKDTQQSRISVRLYNGQRAHDPAIQCIFYDNRWVPQATSKRHSINIILFFKKTFKIKM